MKQAETVATRFPMESDLQADNIRRLSDLINRVYDDAESGMWKRQGTRTNPAEVEPPRNWTHPSKEFLKKWYSRIGYKPHATESLELLHPELVSELATECDFTVWHKPLARGPGPSPRSRS